MRTLHAIFSQHCCHISNQEKNITSWEYYMQYFHNIAVIFPIKKKHNQLLILHACSEMFLQVSSNIARTLRVCWVYLSLCTVVQIYQFWLCNGLATSDSMVIFFGCLMYARFYRHGHIPSLFFHKMYINLKSIWSLYSSIKYLY